MNDSLAQKLAAYQANDKIKQLVQDTPILLLVGPTGAGKDALKAKLLETGSFHHIISHTTRPPRVNEGVAEQNGVEYHFIDKQTAEQMLDDHAFIEAKIYSDNLYGTSVAEIQQAHDDSKVAMTDIEVQGVTEYKAIDPSVMAVFVLPPNFETWQSRLKGRYGATIDAEDFKLRLQTALNELEQLLNTDYYFPVINDSLEETLAEVQAIAESKAHDPSLDDQARQTAQQLYDDTKSYLAKL